MVFLPHFPIHNKYSINDNSPQKLRLILKKLNDPHKKLPPVIHIAGTNGKGSTAMFLANIFQSSNYKTHIYTSPHLHHCNERITIANNQIDDGHLYQIMEEIRLVSKNIPLTLFEGLTLGAILAFSQENADICIIETGMGGRIDATNVIDNKIATIITSISFDHQEYLGNNLFSIACEKSHIMRSNIPSIIAPQMPNAMLALKYRSKEIKNQLIEFNKDFTIEINEDESFDFQYQNTKIKNLAKPSLSGWHQYINAALAIAAIKTISGFDISKDSINKALQNTIWPSRFQKLNHKSLGKNDEIWIDGAHNIQGLRIVADFIKERIVDDFKDNKPKRNYLIVGATKDKITKEFFSPFMELIDFIFTVRVYGESNPEDPKIITKNIKESGIDLVKTGDGIDEAIEFLINLDKENPCRIIICGSMYLARDFKRLI